MIYKSFDDILDRVRRDPVKRLVAVAGATDRHVLEAVETARREGLVQAVLVGEPGEMRRQMALAGLSESDYELCASRDDVDCGWKAMELVRDGHADFIMKGLLNTQEVLRPVVNKEKGLYVPGGFISHISLDQLPEGRLIVVTDAGMHPHPDLEEKRGILENAVSFLRKLGWERPSAAFLCGAEIVAPKIPETVEADALAEMCRRGEIADCDGVGPISFDLAMSREIAQAKHFNCPWSGRFDILLAPNMAAGNLMQKAMLLMGGVKMAGLITGARAPVVLTSRGSSTEEKFVSLALASIVAGSK